MRTAQPERPWRGRLAKAALLTSSGAALLLAPVAAVAQQAGASANASAPPTAVSTSLNEVVVTAARTGSQSIQKVPMAISAIDAGAMVRGGFSDLTEFSGTVPSLTIQQQGQGQNEIIIRGLTDSTYNPTNIEDQTLVSIYLDDTPISLQGATPDLKIFDLERVEVIEGPQGTLYGAGAMAGTIRFITQKPNATRFYGYIEGDDSGTDGGGNNDSVRGMVNVPLIADRLALRVNFYTDQDSGYIDNVGLGEKDANSDRNTQYRAALRFTPNDRVTLDASVTHTDLFANGSDQSYSDLGVDTYTSLTPEKYKDDLSIYNITGLYQGVGFTATSSTSYSDRHLSNDYSSEFLTDALILGYDSPSPMLIRNHTEDLAQEVRFNSSGEGPLKWIGGVYFERQDRNYFQDNPTPGLDAALGVNSVDFGAFENNDLFSALIEQNQRQVAVFGEVTYSLGALDLTAGARYFNFHQTFNLYFGGVAGALGPGQPLTEQGASTEAGVNPRFVANYHLDRHVILYAEAAKGFRYGGVNQPVPASFCGADLAAQGITTPPATFGPDSLWSYSLGEKSTLANGRLTLNADAFYIDWKKIQTNDDLACAYYITENAGQLSSVGMELETALRLTKNFTVSFNGSYTDAQTVGAIANLDAPSGTPAPYSPKYIGSLTGTYNLPLNDRNALEFQGNYQYRSDSLSNYQPELVRVIPSSNVLNLAANFITPRYEFGIFAHNLSNDHVVTSIITNTLVGFQPGDAVYYARPRTIGARLKINF